MGDCERRRIVIGVYGGFTRTRIRIADAKSVETITEKTFHESMNLHTINADRASKKARQLMASRLESMLREILEGVDEYEIVGVCIGITDINALSDQELYQAAFTAAWPLCEINPSLIRVVSGAEVIAGCSKAEYRICLIAGTSSMCLGLQYDETGACINRRQIGGLDLDLSDDGSGASLGHMAMRYALRAAQCKDPYSQVGEAVFGHIGLKYPDEWPKLREVRQGMTKVHLAAITPAIAMLANDEDTDALELLDTAATELEAMVETMIQILPLDLKHTPEGAEILLAGGVWDIPQVLNQINDSWRVPAEWEIHHVDPIDGAIAMALKIAQNQTS